jgi:tetratricopeptide (TPR) repeat protein
MLLAAGQHERALAVYQKSLAIRQLLADSDKGNAQWQSNLSFSYNKIGDVLVAESRREEALASYQKSLAIRQQLADSDKGNAQWQRHLSFSYDRIADMLVAQGQHEKALALYRTSLSIRQQLAATDRGNAEWQNDLRISSGRIGSVAFEFNLAREFTAALEAADQAISLAPDKIWLYTNRAHALMFLGRTEDARALYLRYRGEMNVQGEKTWDAVVVEDFAELRKAGLTEPLMDEIEKNFAGRG